jgi:hypothetical protein
MDSQSDDRHIRAWARAIFALIEADIHIVKSRCLHLCESGKAELPAAEIAMLREEHYQVEGDGRVRTTAARIRAESNMRFAFRVASEVAQVKKWSADFGARGWAAYKRALKIRDRLMHPKRPGDLKLSKEEIGSVMSAYEWFVTTAKGCSAAIWGEP